VKFAHFLVMGIVLSYGNKPTTFVAIKDYLQPEGHNCLRLGKPKAHLNDDRLFAAVLEALTNLAGSKKTVEEHAKVLGRMSY